MLTSHKLWTVHMVRKVKNVPGGRFTKDILVQALGSADAMITAKEVHRGYSVDHVARTDILFWRSR